MQYDNLVKDCNTEKFIAHCYNLDSSGFPNFISGNMLCPGYSNTPSANQNTYIHVVSNKYWTLFALAGGKQHYIQQHKDTEARALANSVISTVCFTVCRSIAHKVPELDLTSPGLTNKRAHILSVENTQPQSLKHFKIK